MACRPHGITVTLYEKQKTGEDGFGRPVYTETPVQVDNVLVAQPASEQITDTINLTGKHLVYVLGIPKGDTHIWTDAKVVFFGSAYRTIGEPIEGIEDLIPLAWNKTVRVERFE